MAANLVEYSASSNLVHYKDNKVLYASDGEPCCCGCCSVTNPDCPCAGNLPLTFRVSLTGISTANFCVNPTSYDFGCPGPCVGPLAGGGSLDGLYFQPQILAPDTFLPALDCFDQSCSGAGTECSWCSNGFNGAAIESTFFAACPPVPVVDWRRNDDSPVSGALKRVSGAWSLAITAGFDSGFGTRNVVRLFSGTYSSPDTDPCCQSSFTIPNDLTTLSFDGYDGVNGAYDFTAGIGGAATVSMCCEVGI